jgi:hypothetical protein
LIRINVDLPSRFRKRSTGGDSAESCLLAFASKDPRAVAERIWERANDRLEH